MTLHLKSQLKKDESVVVPVVTDDMSLSDKAQQLAQSWGLPYVTSLDDAHDVSENYALYLTPQHLELRCADKRHGPVYVDFTKGAAAYRRQYGGGRKQQIASAVGLKKNARPCILDATAGFGRDAFVFASLGGKVALVERSPVIAALLADGIERARLTKELSTLLHQHFILQCSNAVEFIRLIGEDDKPDVIYLDPMYPPQNKSASVKKHVMALRALAGKHEDAEDLLDVALEKAANRVVVKRPDYAGSLCGRKPQVQINMAKHRFDVYITR